jgi:hypothetical protein
VLLDLLDLRQHRPHTLTANREHHYADPHVFLLKDRMSREGASRSSLAHLTWDHECGEDARRIPDDTPGVHGTALDYGIARLEANDLPAVQLHVHFP